MVLEGKSSRIVRGDPRWNFGGCIIIGKWGMKARGVRMKQDQGLGEEFNPFRGTVHLDVT